MSKKIAILPGDGIGPEIINEAVKVLECLQQDYNLEVDLEQAAIGGTAYDESGSPLPEATLNLCKSADAILLGAVGGPQYESLERELRPEKGLLGLRSELQLFSNLRPAILYPQLANASSLKAEIVSGLDMMIVRELTGGIYFGQPRGIRTLENGPKTIKPAVVYFNSCKVFNDPLKAAVLKAGARTYIGGIVNLLIGKSEEVCKCFWDKAIVSSMAMGTALKTCEKNLYPYKDAHGIAGDLGLFTANIFRLVNTMWVPGHNVEVQYPERMFFMTRYGFFYRMKGKPFQTNWLHAAMPTLSIADSKRMRAGSVMLRFRTGPGIWIHSIHVYDGEKRIATYDKLNLTSNVFTTLRFSIPKAPFLYYGLTVSIGITCGEAANLPSNKQLIDLVSVGFEMLLKVGGLPEKQIVVPQGAEAVIKTTVPVNPDVVPVAAIDN